MRSLVWLLAAGAVVVAACSGSPSLPEPSGRPVPKYPNPLRAEPPEGVFVDLSADSARTCGVRASGVIECWGFDYGDPPEGRFVRVDVWDRGVLGNICAVAVDASVKCTSDNFIDPALANQWGQADAPDGEFVDVSVAERFSCGLRTDGSAQCWGDNAGDGAEEPGSNDLPDGALEVPEGPFVEVHAGDPPCALRESGELVCWSDRAMNVLWQEDHTFWDERFVRVSPGWGFSVYFGPLYSRPSPYACGIRRDLTLVCSPDIPDIYVSAPGGEFVQVDHTGGPACGLRTDRTIACWNPRGRPEHDVLADPPAGEFTQIAVGVHHACALRLDGTVACWGQNITKRTGRCKSDVCPA